MMRKLFLLSVIIISVMFVASCASTGGSTTESPAPVSPAPVTPAVVSPAASVSTPPPQPPAQAPQPVNDHYVSGLILTGAKSYTVKRGDTLSGIAWRQYNNGYYYPVIFLASKDVVLDPDIIEPGMQLTVPDLRINLNDARAKANIRNYLLEIAGVEDQRNRRGTANGIRKEANSQ
jgi:hypothetical protein